MNANCNHYYSMVKKISSISGHWPYQKSTRNLFSVVLITLSVISIIIPQIAKMVNCNRDLKCVFEATTSYMLSVTILVKLYACYFSRCKMKVLIDELFIDWNELETPEEYEIMKRYAKNTRRYAIGYVLYCYFALYVFLLMSLIPQVLDVVLPLNESRPRLSAYPAYYFVDESKYSYYILLHAIIAWKIALTGLVSYDCMVLTYIEYVCSIFALIGFAQLIEDGFSLAYAIQVAINTIVISITLLQITQQDANILEVIRYVFYVAGQLIHLFCISFEGQKLIDHSLQTRDKIYNSLWYETSTKWQKMILFVMQRSLQPIFLSAGKIYIFSMQNYSHVLQTSMSYFTVLSSFD
ncbi:hypothetical protein PUN28_015217 [Cardiocondyla obscurior]|uniref:Odorant receptor n=1 Tax=Cardiocondyla obscurior TaxID=286306 RepID=A0AAW2F325_9HYME